MGKKDLWEKEKELDTLNHYYSRFSERMTQKIDNDVAPRVKESRKRGANLRLRYQVDIIKKRNEKVYANQRRSYTKNQVFLGGVPIYVDDEYRDAVIPQATQQVETFYDSLRKIDAYETLDSDQEENFFVKQLQSKRRELEESRQDKLESWLDR